MHALRAHRRPRNVERQKRVMIGAENESTNSTDDAKRTAKGLTIGLLLFGLAGILIIADE